MAEFAASGRVPAMGRCYMEWPVEVVEPENATGIAAVQELWAEYWGILGFPSDYQDFAEERRTLPGKYSRPGGRLLLAQVEGRPAGTGAFRRLSDNACEGKRLYVRAEYRRRGIAASLLGTIVREARLCGYRYLYGDTMPTMKSALALYREAGFVEVGPYGDSPSPGAIYVCLTL